MERGSQRQMKGSVEKRNPMIFLFQSPLKFELVLIQLLISLRHPSLSLVTRINFFRKDCCSKKSLQISCSDYSRVLLREKAPTKVTDKLPINITSRTQGHEVYAGVGKFQDKGLNYLSKVRAEPNEVAGKN